MMKNSKLSKLLVAGVSVAVLASAVAPMAFAEASNEAGVDPTKTQHDLAVYISGVKEYGEWSSNVSDFWNNTVDTTRVDGIVYFDKDPATGKYNATIDPDDFYSVKSSVDYAKLTGWYIDNFTGEAGSTEGKLDDKDFATATPIDVDTLALKAKTLNQTKYKDAVRLIADYDVEDTFTVYLDFGISVNNYGKIDGVDLNGFAAADKNVLSTTNVYKMDVLQSKSVVLPTVVTDPEYYFAGWKIKIDTTAPANYGAFASFDETSYVDSNPYNESAIDFSELAELDEDSTYIVVKPVIKQITSVKVLLQTLNNAGNATTITNVPVTSMVTKDASSSKDVTLANIDGIDAANKALFKKMATSTGTTVKVTDDAVTLPVLTTTTSGWTFSGWALVNDEDKADGKTSIKKNTLIGSSLDPSIFAGTVSGDSIELKPVFVKGTTPDPVITYLPAAKTPNDKITKYSNGVAVEVKTWAEFNNFQGGLFYNEKDETFAYYKNKNNEGKFVVDTTVNGLVDGIVFDKGVQDTEAYGLYKVSDSDPFFYLVSDGVYQADYTGMWEDEDGSVYKLEKGCTNTTFTGVYDRGDWALSVKDSKVQKDETGFVLYGDTQYWFINGICNMKETEAVRQHTNGRFYYTVGAKIDFTFNGTVNGHTFVNGEAAE